MHLLRNSTRRFGGWLEVTRTIALAVLLAGPAAASPPSHDPGYCWFPLIIADRWLDDASIPGFTGGERKAPDWRNNGVLDHESFTDLNQSGVFEPGEPFADANGNGIFDSEVYGPLLTGYVPVPTPGNLVSPGGDLGLRIALTPASSRGDERPGHYLTIQENCLSTWVVFDRASGADLRTVDRLLQRLIAADPAAAWDPLTQQIVGSTGGCRSPRVISMPLYDPRVPLFGAHDIVVPTKAIPAFLESASGKGEATLIVLPPSAFSPYLGLAPTGDSPAVVTAPAIVPWGRVKASYR